MEGAWGFCLGTQLPSEMLYSKCSIMHLGFCAYDGSRGRGWKVLERKPFITLQLIEDLPHSKLQEQHLTKPSLVARPATPAALLLC